MATSSLGMRIEERMKLAVQNFQREETVHSSVLKELEILDEHGSVQDMNSRTFVFLSLWTALASDAKKTETFSHAFYALFRKTAIMLLSPTWASVDENLKQKMTEIFVRCGKDLNLVLEECEKLCLALNKVAYDPWGNHMWKDILSSMLDIEDYSVKKCLESEPEELILARVQFLVHSDYEKEALCLSKFCFKYYSRNSKGTLLCKNHNSAQQFFKENNVGRNDYSGFSSLEWFLFLLQRKNKLSDIVKETGTFSCHEGVQMIRCLRMKSSYHPLTETLTHVFLVRDFMFSSTYCCTKELLNLWCALQVERYSLTTDISEAVRKLLVTYASTSAHFYLFVDVLWEKFGSTFLPLYVEMYIRGLTADVNYLEAARGTEVKETVLELETHVASVLSKLSTLFIEGNEEVARECMLSAFSLKPTRERLYIIQSLTHSLLSKEAKNSDIERNPSFDSDYLPEGRGSVQGVLKKKECRCGFWWCLTEKKSSPTCETSSNSELIFSHPLLSKSMKGVPYSLVLDLVSILECVRCNTLQFNVFDWHKMGNQLDDYLKNHSDSKTASKTFVEHNMDSETGSCTEIEEMESEERHIKIHNDYGQPGTSQGKSPMSNFPNYVPFSIPSVEIPDKSEHSTFLNSEHKLQTISEVKIKSDFEVNVKNSQSLRTESSNFVQVDKRTTGDTCANIGGNPEIGRQNSTESHYSLTSQVNNVVIGETKKAFIQTQSSIAEEQCSGELDVNNLPLLSNRNAVVLNSSAKIMLSKVVINKNFISSTNKVNTAVNTDNSHVLQTHINNAVNKNTVCSAAATCSESKLHATNAISSNAHFSKLKATCIDSPVASLTLSGDVKDTSTVSKTNVLSGKNAKQISAALFNVEKKEVMVSSELPNFANDKIISDHLKRSEYVEYSSKQSNSVKENTKDFKESDIFSGCSAPNAKHNLNSHVGLIKDDSITNNNNYANRVQNKSLTFPITCNVQQREATQIAGDNVSSQLALNLQRKSHGDVYVVVPRNCTSYVQHKTPLSVQTPVDAKRNAQLISPSMEKGLSENLADRDISFGKLVPEFLNNQYVASTSSFKKTESTNEENSHLLLSSEKNKIKFKIAAPQDQNTSLNKPLHIKSIGNTWDLPLYSQRPQIPGSVDTKMDLTQLNSSGDKTLPLTAFKFSVPSDIKNLTTGNRLLSAKLVIPVNKSNTNSSHMSNDGGEGNKHSQLINANEAQQAENNVQAITIPGVIFLKSSANSKLKYMQYPQEVLDNSNEASSNFIKSQNQKRIWSSQRNIHGSMEWKKTGQRNFNLGNSVHKVQLRPSVKIPFSVWDKNITSSLPAHHGLKDTSDEPPVKYLCKDSVPYATPADINIAPCHVFNLNSQAHESLTRTSSVVTNVKTATSTFQTISNSTSFQANTAITGIPRIISVTKEPVSCSSNFVHKSEGISLIKSDYSQQIYPAKAMDPFSLSCPKVAPEPSLQNTCHQTFAIDCSFRDHPVTNNVLKTEKVQFAKESNKVVLKTGISPLSIASTNATAALERTAVKPLARHVSVLHNRSKDTACCTSVEMKPCRSCSTTGVQSNEKGLKDTFSDNTFFSEMNINQGSHADANTVVKLLLHSSK